MQCLHNGNSSILKQLFINCASPALLHLLSHPSFSLLSALISVHRQSERRRDKKRQRLKRDGERRRERDSKFKKEGEKECWYRRGEERRGETPGRWEKIHRIVGAAVPATPGIGNSFAAELRASCGCSRRLLRIPQHASPSCERAATPAESFTRATQGAQDVTCDRHVRPPLPPPPPLRERRDHHADMDTGVLIALVSVLAVSCSGAGDLDLGTIVFANVLYRHGDRTPVSPYKNDPYRNESSWPVPYGQLTNIGKHQHLLLGRWLRKRYSHLLSDIYTPYDIYVHSTDVDRTLMSAEANLAGLYPPVKNQVWDSIKWMPIPVHTIPENQDYVLKGSKYCPRYDYELEKLLMSPEMERINKENAKLYAYLSESTGDKISSLKTAEHLYDVLYIEQLYNKTLPLWTKSVFPEKLKPIAIMSFMTETYNKILQRLKLGPLLGEMIDHMVKKAQHTLQPDRKLWMYSAHDETIANILMTLNLFEPHCPPYAATVLVELRTNVENQYFVTVFYKNTTEEPILMTLPNCATLCPLNEFINLTKNVVPEDWERECLIDRNDISSSDVIAILTSSILMLVLLVLIIIGFMYWRHKREHRQYYFRLSYNGYNDAI